MGVVKVIATSSIKLPNRREDAKIMLFITFIETKLNIYFIASTPATLQLVECEPFRRYPMQPHEISFYGYVFFIPNLYLLHSLYLVCVLIYLFIYVLAQQKNSYYRAKLQGYKLTNDTK